MIIAVENHAFAHQHMHPGIKQVEGKAPVFRQQIPGAFNKTVHLLNRTAMLQNPERRKSEGKLLITLKRVDVRHMGNNVVDSPRPCLVRQHRDFVPDHVNRMKFKIRMLLGNRQQNPPGAGADFNHPVVVQPALVFRQQTAVKSNVFLAFLVKNVIKFRSVFISFHLHLPDRHIVSPLRRQIILPRRRPGNIAKSFIGRFVYCTTVCTKNKDKYNI